MPKPATLAKRALFGRARAVREPAHQLLPPWMGLPVLAGNPLSSMAYATQEMMLVLALAGSAALATTMPLSVAVGVLLVLVITGSRRAVRVYPNAGGGYGVTRRTLGTWPGLVVGASLLCGSVLTVTVSVSAGVAAVAAVLGGMPDLRVLLALGLLMLVLVVNLRGAREGGLLFALPAAVFVLAMLTFVVVGVARCGLGWGGCPTAPSAGLTPDVTGAVTLFVVVRAFASGATVVAGFETIPGGITVFRYPQSRHTAWAIGIIGAVALTLFLGVSYVAAATGAVPQDGTAEPLLSEIARTVLGRGPGYVLVQLATAAVLLVAASTAFADLPRLSSAVAVDGFLARQLLSRGDHLVFSNGIVLAGLAAAALLVAFDADVTRLVPLYLVAVLLTFTLSQAGMVVHWLRTRGERWGLRLLHDAGGAVSTGVALGAVVLTRFTAGVWIVLSAVVALAMVMARIHRHYARVRTQLTENAAVCAEAPRPQPGRFPNHVVLLVDRVDESTARALSYAQSVDATSLEALVLPGAGRDVEARWAQLTADLVPERLDLATGVDAGETVATALGRRVARHGPSAFTTVVVGEELGRTWGGHLRHHLAGARVKARLLRDGGLVVSDLTSPHGGPGPYTVEEPVAHHVVVLVPGVHRAALRALAYAEGLRPTSLRALSVSLGSGRKGLDLLEQWQAAGISTPLEIVDSPFRTLTGSITHYVRRFAPDGRQTMITCVLPHFVLDHWYHRPLHNQTAAQIKAALLFEPGVVTTSVPFPLEPDAQAPRETIGTVA